MSSHQPRQPYTRGSRPRAPPIPVSSTDLCMTTSLPPVASPQRLHTQHACAARCPKPPVRGQAPLAGGSPSHSRVPPGIALRPECIRHHIVFHVPLASFAHLLRSLCTCSPLPHQCRNQCAHIFYR